MTQAALASLWRLPLLALGINVRDADELAAVLQEISPELQVERTRGRASINALAKERRGSSLQLPGKTGNARLASVVPLTIVEGGFSWSDLVHVVCTENLKDASESDSRKMLVEINTGGKVFFCFFRSAQSGGQEGIAVIKFGADRLLMQAEQFANEITRMLDPLGAPNCRLVRMAGAGVKEWQACALAAAALGDLDGGGEVMAEMAALPCFLLMEFVPGAPLFRCDDAFEDASARASTFEGLGRLFLLDMLLGNADRLPCQDLGWRGNPSNILYGRTGTRFAGRPVAIDSCVQRRPPAGKMNTEDEGVDRLAQLMLTDMDFARDLLQRQLVSAGRAAVLAVEQRPAECAAAFQKGVRVCLEGICKIKGLLEMMQDKVLEWVAEFIADIQSTRPNITVLKAGCGASPTISTRPASAFSTPVDQDGSGPRGRVTGSGRTVSSAGSRLSNSSSPGGGSGSKRLSDPGRARLASAEGAVGTPHAAPLPHIRRHTSFKVPALDVTTSPTSSPHATASPDVILDDPPMVVARHGHKPTVGKGLNKLSSPTSRSPASRSPSSPSSRSHTPLRNLTVTRHPSPFAGRASQSDGRVILYGRSGSLNSAIPSPLSGGSGRASPTLAVGQRRPESIRMHSDPAVAPVSSTTSSPGAEAAALLRSASTSARPGHVFGAVTPVGRPPRSGVSHQLTPASSRPADSPAPSSGATRTPPLSPARSSVRFPALAAARSASRSPARSPLRLKHGSSYSPQSAPASAMDGSEALRKRVTSPYLKRNSTAPGYARARPAALAVRQRSTGERGSTPTSTNEHETAAQAAYAAVARAIVAAPGNGGGKALVRRPGVLQGSGMSLTAALKNINVEARKDNELSNRVKHWETLFRQRCGELRAAVDEWQARQGVGRVLSTGFLDGTHPIVDTYELKVRLDHILRRLRVLTEAASACMPARVTPELFVGNAVAADSHHILRHLGVTHIVNATSELLLPPPSAGFIAIRVALRDVDDEDIGKHFEVVSAFISSATACGGRVLVHCSEGKSRSVTLVLAHLMRTAHMNLRSAYDLVKCCRPQADPNAGFMTLLMHLDEQLYGSRSMKLVSTKKAKPEPVMCPICNASVGVSAASLAVHLRSKHPGMTAPSRATSDAAALAAHTVAQPLGAAATAATIQAAPLVGSLADGAQAS